jgi:hypothetical protein
MEPESAPTAAAAAAAPAAAIAAATGKPTFRHDWYQSAGSVVLSIYAKGQRNEDVKVDCTTQEV